MKQLGEIEGASGQSVTIDGTVFEEDDLLLYALLTDPIYCAELLWKQPDNFQYGECYRVWDYQYPLWRSSEFGQESKNYKGYACGRGTGKSESIKGKAFCHAFRRNGEDMLLSTPELIHLLPLTDKIEDRIQDTRLTREFLDMSHGRTGFTHRPFGVDYIDGTRIVGRIPRVTGVGVKGQHAPDLIIDEAQDYPEAGWTEVHATVKADHVDQDGNPDFNYEFYGVHSGDRSGGFHARTTQGSFSITQITAIQRPGWSAEEKGAAIAAHGGTSSPDYRRNILGEPGSAASALFVTARLLACVDQDRQSTFNTLGYSHQNYRFSEVEEQGIEMANLLDLPSDFGDVYCGMDVGLTISPTVITIFSNEKVKNVERLKLIRRIQLEQFRTKQIREIVYAISAHFGSSLKGFGMDVTGIGFPMFQEMEDDENVPAHLLKVQRGYFFNSKVPVGVQPEHVVRYHDGQMKDQLGNAVIEEVDPLTGASRFVVQMPMIEASSRYLREFVDSGFLMLPFDTDITRDMQLETGQRVQRVAGMRRSKPNAFHILDSMRAMAMGYKAEMVEREIAFAEPDDALDYAYDPTSPTFELEIF